MKPDPSPASAPEPETVNFARECLLRRGRHLATPDNMELQVSYLADRIEWALHTYFWQAPKQTNPPYVTIQSSAITGLYNVIVMKFNARTDEYSLDRIGPRMRRAEAEGLARSWAAAGGWEIR